METKPLSDDFATNHEYVVLQIDCECNVALDSEPTIGCTTSPTDRSSMMETTEDQVEKPQHVSVKRWASDPSLHTTRRVVLSER